MVTRPRSHKPDRYRAVIYATAEQILGDANNGKVSEADSNGSLRSAYPGYFDQPGAAPTPCTSALSELART